VQNVVCCGVARSKLRAEKHAASKLKFREVVIDTGEVVVGDLFGEYGCELL
jgi:hypothetical protein